jgi:hypothetical protein
MMQNQELKRDLGRYLERIGTGVASDAYRRGWDACFGKNECPEDTQEESSVDEKSDVDTESGTPSEIAPE